MNEKDSLGCDSQLAKGENLLHFPPPPSLHSSSCLSLLCWVILSFLSLSLPNVLSWLDFIINERPSFARADEVIKDGLKIGEEERKEKDRIQVTSPLVTAATHAMPSLLAETL